MQVIAQINFTQLVKKPPSHNYGLRNKSALATGTLKTLRLLKQLVTMDAADRANNYCTATRDN